MRAHSPQQFHLQGQACTTPSYEGFALNPLTKADGAAHHILTRLAMFEVTVRRMPHAKIWVLVGPEMWQDRLDKTGNCGRCYTQMNENDFYYLEARDLYC